MNDDAGNDTLFGLIQPPKLPFTGNYHLLETTIYSGREGIEIKGFDWFFSLVTYTWYKMIGRPVTFGCLWYENTWSS